MTADVVLNLGTGGDTARAIDKGGIKTQVVTLDVGGSGAETLVAGTVPVSGTVAVTGVATSAKQDTGNTSLASLDGKVTACNTGAVVVSSSALPSGAATGAKQDTGNTSLASIDSGVAAVAASASVLDDWDESDRAKVNPIVGQAGVQGGSGAVSNTTQRVVLATDVALPAGTNAIGKLAANAGVTIGSVEVVASATGGCSTMNASSSDGSTALTSTAQVIKASAGKLQGYYIYNPNATAQFVQFYNTAAASVTVGTTNPLFMLTIPATSAANLFGETGIDFSTAMSWAATSTAGGNGAPGTALDAVCWYK